MYNSKTLGLRNAIERAVTNLEKSSVISGQPRYSRFWHWPWPREFEYRRSGVGTALTHSMQIPHSILQVWQEAQGKQSICISIGEVEKKAWGDYRLRIGKLHCFFFACDCHDCLLKFRDCAPTRETI
jgi:hypothetical protein